MRKNKVSLLALLAVILVFSMMLVPLQARETTNVQISINGEALDIPQEYGYPFIDRQARTIVPIRIISETLGHNVEWEGSTRTAIIDDIRIKIGDNKIQTPDGIIKMDTVAIIKDNRTHVPVRFVAEALGYEISYDGPKYSNGYKHMVDIKGEIKTPTDNGNTENTINHDLAHMKFNSNIDVEFQEKGHSSGTNIDFGVIYKPWADDLQNQYNDMEKLLKARFGNHKAIGEIMAYMKAHDGPNKSEYPDKDWIINGQLVWVSPSDWNGNLTVWRK